jgi:hypothetical protein
MHSWCSASSSNSQRPSCRCISRYPPT